MSKRSPLRSQPLSAPAEPTALDAATLGAAPSAAPRIVPLPSNHHSPRDGGRILAVVIHATAGTDSRDWLVQNSRGVSAHVLIQKDGTIYRMVDEARAAHHAGFSAFTWPTDGKRYTGKTRPNTNQVTLGIELENLNDGRDPYPEAQLAALAWQLRDYQARYGRLPLIRHEEIDTQGKSDPVGLDYLRLYLLRESDDLTWVSPPRITADVFGAVLAARRSPAAPLAADLYARIVRRGVDPGLVLGVYDHESKCGTLGAATVTNSIGNNRRGRGRHTKVGPVPGSRGNFAHYATIADALEDLLDHLLLGYVAGDVFGGVKLPTLGASIPIYAPAEDKNKPEAYIADVRANLRRWGGVSDPWTLWGPDWPPARDHGIPQRWLREGNLGQPLGPEQALGPGRAAQAFERGTVLWFAPDRTEVVR